MHKEDLIFLHAPSVYDFRKESIFYGPVSDLVPSTPVFEMYPFGFTTMAVRLDRAGYNVRIVNLATLMLNHPKLDVKRYLSKLEADVFGIDLHWLPHAHGALEVAKMVKGLHPSSKILMGGFSSSYFHEELIRYPQVDLVLRGDSVEEPIVELMDSLSKSEDLSKVPNLTWKDASGRVHVNDLTCVPNDLDNVEVDYGWMMRSVIRHRDLEGVMPFKDWDRYPLTAVFTVRGCSMNCAECGGSCGAMKRVLGRTRPAFRSPEKVAQDISDIQGLMNAPIFVVGDLRQNGPDYANRFFSEARRLKVDGQVILETFTPASSSFFEQADATFSDYSIQFSPDSHDEKVRYALGRHFDNASMEKSITSALANGCKRVDIFFMIGLPEQTIGSAIGSSDFARHMYGTTNNDDRLSFFTSPLAPFLDPGSIAFEDPGKFGYKQFARTLEEHRARLAYPYWRDVLSYETLWMTRDQIVETSYNAADKLNEVRAEAGQISRDDLKLIRERSENARALMNDVSMAMNIKDDNERSKAMADLKMRGDELMESTICQKRDLEWRTPSIYMNMPKAILGMFRRKHN